VAAAVRSAGRWAAEVRGAAGDDDAVAAEVAQAEGIMQLCQQQLQTFLHDMCISVSQVLLLLLLKCTALLFFSAGSSAATESSTAAASTSD
jgi:hypothetical protein